MRFLAFRGSSSFICLPNSESASPSREQSVPAQPTLRQQNRSFIFLPDLPSLRLSGQWDTNRADQCGLGSSRYIVCRLLLEKKKKHEDAHRGDPSGRRDQTNA